MVGCKQETKVVEKVVKVSEEVVTLTMPLETAQILKGVIGRIAQTTEYGIKTAELYHAMINIEGKFLSIPIIRI